MTLLQIRYILSIVSAGSMNKAAEKLYVSQPTLTSAIKEAEKELGFPLFKRSNQGVALTNEGEEFMAYARQIWQSYDLMEKHFRDPALRKRKFAVSTQHYSFVTKAFIETVRDFGTSRFDFAIRETTTGDVIRDVTEGRSAYGFLYRSRYNKPVLSKILKENKLEFVKLLDCRVCVYLAKKHPLAGHECITEKDLEPYPFLTFEQGEDSSGFFAEEIYSEKEHARSIHTTDRAAMLNLMSGLDGYTLCSGIIEDDLNGDYLAIPYVDTEIKHQDVMEVGYIQKKGFEGDAVSEKFLYEVKKMLREGNESAILL